MCVFRTDACNYACTCLSVSVCICVCASMLEVAPFAHSCLIGSDRLSGNRGDGMGLIAHVLFGGCLHSNPRVEYTYMNPSFKQDCSPKSPKPLRPLRRPGRESKLMPGIEHRHIQPAVRARDLSSNIGGLDSYLYYL